MKRITAVIAALILVVAAMLVPAQVQADTWYNANASVVEVKKIDQDYLMIFKQAVNGSSDGDCFINSYTDIIVYGHPSTPQYSNSVAPEDYFKPGIYQLQAKVSILYLQDAGTGICKSISIHYPTEKATAEKE